LASVRLCKKRRDEKSASHRTKLDSYISSQIFLLAQDLLIHVKILVDHREMPVHYSLVSLQTQKRLKQSLKIGFSSMLREVPLFYGTSLVEEGSCLELGGDQSGSPLISVLGGDVVSDRTRFV
jgi:hypothetical protein